MKRFKNILYYADGRKQDSATLKRAVALAESNHARLTLVDVIEPVETPSEIKEHFNIEMNEILESQHQQVLEGLAKPYQDPEHLIYTRVLFGISFIEIIQFVQSGGYDLVIKQARPPEGISERLFGSHDLHLMRKCPCPVLIDRDGEVGHYSNILAAVDTEDATRGGCDTLVMDLASSLAQREKARLDVVHAWHLPGETMFRGGRFRLPAFELENMLSHEQQTRFQRLEKLLSPYGLTPSQPEVHLEKGPPAKTINRIAQQQDTDIIVMGTVGRVGIPGLFIGNTAEEVLQTTSCSVLTVKPDGFVSPVQ